MDINSDKKQSLRALQATNFFLADVQTGLGPFLAAYLAGAGWEPGRVGMALTLGGIITVLLQTPAGAIVDQMKSKRLILVIACGVLVVGATLLSITAAPVGGVHIPGSYRGRRTIPRTDVGRSYDGNSRREPL
ncbi:hypothetical protein [Granulicella sp. dw_53]|uniref:hypothetical protein n=1 Tax=Granulicella sp. dw_53 TaxID=2719792 RepID=UPI002106161E|nr:hypothetical protein [Granulicella sp. dw_53]